VPRDEQHGLTGADARAVLAIDANRYLGIEQPEGLERQGNAADDSVLSSHERTARSAVRDNSRDRGDVVERAIFIECRANRFAQRRVLEWKTHDARAIDRRDRERSNGAWG